MKSLPKAKIPRVLKSRTLPIDQSTRSKVELDVSPREVFSSLQSRLAGKYDNCLQTIHLRYIHELVKKRSRPHSILYIDHLDLDHPSQFLEGYFHGSSLAGRLEEAIGYYVFYDDIPRVFINKFSTIVTKSIEQQRVVKYKLLRLKLGVQDSDYEEIPEQVTIGERYLPSSILEVTNGQNSLDSMVRQLSQLIQLDSKKGRGALVQSHLNKQGSRDKILAKYKTDKSNRTKKGICRSQSHDRVDKVPKEQQITRVKPKQKGASSKKKQVSIPKSSSFAKHTRQNTKSPETQHSRQKSGKKHSRMYSGQWQSSNTHKQLRHLGKSSYQHLLSPHSIKPKQAFLKKKAKFL